MIRLGIDDLTVDEGEEKSGTEGLKEASPLCYVWPIACLCYSSLAVAWLVAVIWTARGCKPDGPAAIELFG